MEGLKPAPVQVEITPSDQELPKPKKKRSKKNDDNSINDIKNLISAIFGILSFAVGPEWEISDGEANSIATPLKNILDRYDLTSKIGQASDGFMLVSALGMVIIPRVLMTKNKKTQKNVKNKDNVVEMKEIAEKREVSKDNKQPNGNVPPKHTDGDIIKAISTIIHQ